jgi:hypothetical protein
VFQRTFGAHIEKERKEEKKLVLVSIYVVLHCIKEEHDTKYTSTSSLSNIVLMI